MTPPGLSGCEEVFATQVQTSLLTGEAAKTAKKKGMAGLLYFHIVQCIRKRE